MSNFKNRMNYVWQSMSLMIPIIVYMYMIIKAFASPKLSNGLTPFVAAVAVGLNELLANKGILTDIIPVDRYPMCGLLNVNKNYYMFNSTIILSFTLAYYGLNMYFGKINKAFLILLSSFLLMDVMYNVLICNVHDPNMYIHIGVSIVYGGIFGLVWSSLSQLIPKQSKKKKKVTRINGTEPQ